MLEEVVRSDLEMELIGEDPDRLSELAAAEARARWGMAGILPELRAFKTGRLMSPSTGTSLIHMSFCIHLSGAYSVGRPVHELIN